MSDCEAAAVFVSDDQCIPSVETVALPAGVVAPGEIAARAERDAEGPALGILVVDREAQVRLRQAVDVRLLLGFQRVPRTPDLRHRVDLEEGGLRR